MGWSESAAAARAATRGSFGEKAEGRTVTFRPSAGPSLEIDGVFTRPHAAVQPSAAGAEVSTYSATLGSVELSWFAATVTNDDKVEIRGRLWRVMDTLDDGEGGTSFVLKDLGALP